MADNTFALNEDVNVKTGNPLKSLVPLLVILGCILLGYIMYFFVLGNPDNFEGGDTENHPIDEGVGKWLGLLYKGGILVGMGLGLLMMIISFSVERSITLNRAKGKVSPDVFVKRIQLRLEDNDVDGAIAECDAQRGTVGNVVRESLKRYKNVANDSSMTKEQKVDSIRQAIEEATALELPMLEKNLVIIATIVSIGTLWGLIGTVLGMIRAFAELGAGGAPDAAKLSVGISEALVNTLLGITTSTLATIAYNVFTSRIDGMTYRIDEVGISIVETFKTKHN